MTLDLTRTEHRDEFAEACLMRLNNPETADRMLAAARGIASTGAVLSPAFAAHIAISSPVESAAVVRALLEGCGVNASVEQWPMTADGDYVVKWDADEGTYNHGSHIEITRDMENVPVLILRLLACTTREEALTALREAGR